MVGRSLGRYRVTELLGRGGMGEVYLATDPELRRRIAVKVLPDRLSGDEEAMKRLLREARSAAAVDHPYLCKVYEVGFDGQTAFIAMELVEGMTLEEKLRQGPLPLPATLAVAGEIAEALGKVHQLGLIHRDLKPANVMLTPDGHVKVMDFGLAKQVTRGENDVTETLLTQNGVAPGTPAYMSPEQIRGEALDSRSDVFSFGVVLWEMLSGTRLFARASLPATIAAVLAEEPPAPKDVPEPLRLAVARMLSKRREDRHRNLGDVLVELRGLVSEPGGPATRPVRPPHPTGPNVAGEKIAEFRRRAEALRENFSDPQSLHWSVEEWENVLALDPEYPPALAGAATSRVLLAWNSKADPELLEVAERQAEAALALDPEAADAYVALTFLFTLRGLMETADRMSARSIALAPEDAWVLQARARFLMDLYGDFREAERLARKATESAPDHYPAWFQLGWAEMEQGHFADAERAFRRAIELQPGFGGGLMGLGVLLLATGRNEEARDVLHQALEIDPDSVQSLFFGGIADHRLDEAGPAAAAFGRLVKENPGHPLAMNAQLFLALELMRLGDENAGRLALAAAEKGFKRFPKQWFGLEGMAGVAAARGRRDEAFAWLARAEAAGLKSALLLESDPALEPLMEDPRFHEQLARMRAGAEGAAGQSR